MIEQRLAALGLRLPEAPPAVANYVGVVVVGSLAFVAGHGPYENGEYRYKGKLGRDFDTAAGYDIARLVMLNCLASLRQEIGDLDRVLRIVRVFGMINSTPDFTDHPQVLDGASDLLTDLFGVRGKHARAAVGMAALPMGISVEIEMLAEVVQQSPLQ